MQNVKRISSTDERADCPFCGQGGDNPAFSINPAKQVFHCNSCGAKGHTSQLAVHGYEGAPESTNSRGSTNATPSDKADATWDRCRSPEMAMKYLTKGRGIPEFAVSDLIGPVIRGGVCRMKGDVNLIDVECMVYRLGGAIQRTPVQKLDRKAFGKRMLGKVSGQCWFGPEGSPRVIITEGMENALAIRSLPFNAAARYCVAGSSANFKKINRPGGADRIEIWADDDWKNPDNPGMAAAEELAARVGGMVVRPPRHPMPLDWNDLLAEGLLAGWSPVFEGASGRAESDPDDFEALIADVPFPAEVLPKDVRVFLHARSRALNVNESALYCAFLGMVSVAAGGSASIRVPSLDWEERAILWMALVGRSGAGKTPAFNVAGLGTLTDWQTSLIEKWREERKRYELELNQYKDADKGERRELFPAGRPVEPEFPKQAFTTIATIETILDANNDNPEGTGFCADEMASVLDSRNQYKGGSGSDTPILLDLWNGRGVTNNVRGMVRNLGRAYVPMVGGIQPALLGKIIGASSITDGFSSRFIFAHIAQQSDVLHANEAALLLKHVPEEVKQSVSTIITGLVRARGTARVYDLSKDAEAAFLDFQYESRGRAKFDEEYLESPRLKMVTYVLRFSLVLHLIKGAEGAVCISTMLDAIALSKFFWAATERAYSHVHQDTASASRLAVYEKIQRMGEGTRHDVRNALRRKIPYKESGAIIDWLIAKEWVTESKTSIRSVLRVNAKVK